MKINDYIHTIKDIIKPPNPLRLTSNKKLIKSLSEEEIIKAKNIIDNKITKEGNEIQQIINNYIKKIRDSFDNKNYEKNKMKIKKDFKNYNENMNLDRNMKIINYTKVKPQQIKDKESANLIRIKKFLYPSNFDLNKLKGNKMNKHNISFILKKNSSMNDIYKRKIVKINLNAEDKLNKVNVNGKDTMEVLSDLMSQGEYLSEILNKKLEKINSLIEIKLPFPSNYELILKYIKNNPKLLNYEDSIRMKYATPISKEKKNNIIQNMRNRLLTIKEDIEKKTDEFLQNNLTNSIFLPKLNNSKTTRFYSKINSAQSITCKSSDNIESTNSFDIKNDTVFLTSKK